MKFLLSFSLLLCFSVTTVCAQQTGKKPLDHSVYDGWQSIGERMISNDGQWVAYAVNPQEGDGELIIQSNDGQYKKTIARGYGAVITDDSKYLICRIRPFFNDTRQARIKKKKPEESPKDSLVIVQLGTTNETRLAKLKSFKTPERAGGWLAYQLEKEAPAADSAKAKRPVAPGLAQQLDSAKKVIDSLLRLLPNKKKKDEDADALTAFFADEPGAEEGNDLVLKNLNSGDKKVFRYVSEYYFNRTGKKLLFETTPVKKDSLSKTLVLLYDLASGRTDTLSRAGNDFKNFVMDEAGTQVAYVAERDSSSKSLQKFYKLWYYKAGSDSARLLADRNTKGMATGWTISENANISFSKSGKRLFFGTAPVQPPKDTTLVEIDLVKVDVWHYNDDYLQTVQLKNLDNELKRSYLATYDFNNRSVVQLADKTLENITTTQDGDGEQFVGSTNLGKRVESQWTGQTRQDIYAVNPETGSRVLIKKDVDGRVFPSYTGKYIVWYDNKARHYFAWDHGTTRNITAAIKVPLYDEENDTPDDPGAYGVMRWGKHDEVVYIYDRYGFWAVDPQGKTAPKAMVKNARTSKITYRYIPTDPDERVIENIADSKHLYRVVNEKTKQAGFGRYMTPPGEIGEMMIEPYAYGNPLKARNADVFIYTKETYEQSPNLVVNNNWSKEVKLSSINPQQANYNWGTAELFQWKTFKGKSSTGILYKPEDFDSTKKYPMIVYFYEKLSDGLYQYQAPSPTPSRLNISFFVSRGYLVFTPDIAYEKGKPGASAYDYIVSGSQALAKNKWVDKNNIGIQGQSWGGYQVAHLITATNMFKAAWAGAPVVNMTSAYGGIRWESGLNRQFQYEKSQSRIGATLWERPDLYIENSPLFHLPKVTTPLVIMSNDNDGAVPWYQGIEMFTAMRRLQKKVWLLNYNGEAHNLIERKNRKDIQIREQQFFDWLLKGEKPAQWISEGVPATQKGKDWGLKVETKAGF